MEIVNKLKTIFDILLESKNEWLGESLGEKVVVRMPMIMKNNKGIRAQKYATYTGSRVITKDKSLRDVYSLIGAKGRNFILKITKHGGYALYSDKSMKKPISFGTMSDKYAPEIVVK